MIYIVYKIFFIFKYNELFIDSVNTECPEVQNS